jgi:hypothetical protein
MASGSTSTVPPDTRWVFSVWAFKWGAPVGPTGTGVHEPTRRGRLDFYPAPSFKRAKRVSSPFT